MPNIKGFWNEGIGAPVGDGVLFKTSGSGGRASMDGGYYNTPRIDFNASAYNTIYSDNIDTVQPPTMQLIQQIRY